MNYDAVIFDLFGTLIDFLSVEQYREWDRKMAVALSAPVDEFPRLWFATLHDRNAGYLPTMEEEILHVCHLLGLSPDSSSVAEAIKTRLNMHRLNLAPKPDAVPTLTALRSMGLKTGLLSDAPLDVPAIWPETPFAALMDAAVFSCEERTTKPDPALYATTCKRLGVQAERCLFVGDGGSQELTGAVNAGMTGVLVRTSYGLAFEKYAPEAKTWTGPAITALTEVFSIVRQN